MKVCSGCQRCYEDSVGFCTDECNVELPEARREGGPKMIAGYRLEFLIENGVRGESYRARHVDSAHSCLVKILRGNENFFPEAKVGAALIHPNVLDVYDAGSLETGEFYVVEEAASGQSLREYLNQVGVPELLTSIQVLRQTAEALHAIHLKGLIHRTLRPENIFLTVDNAEEMMVRIGGIDFGGAAEHAIVSNKFLIDTALDSLRYFSPEQCAGEAVTLKSDVYSLGVVLYEMLSGVPPFDAPNAAGIIQKHASERAAEIKIDNFDLRMLITHTLMESLSKKPDYRQSSANAFARQLRHIELLATHVSTPPPAVASRQTLARGVAAASYTAGPPPTLVTVINQDDIRPVAVKIEQHAVASASAIPRNEPIPVPEARLEPPAVEEVRIQREQLSAPEIRVESETPTIPEQPVKIIEAAPVADLVIDESPILLSEEEHCAVELPKSQTEAHYESRLPRMKSRLKRWRAKTPSSSEEPTSEPFAVAASIVETPVAAALVEPKKIEWEQPEDDLPSLEDVIEVLQEEAIPFAPVVMAEDIVVKPQTACAPIEVAKADPVEPRVAAAIPSKKQPFVAVPADPDEITVVPSPRKRITVDIAQTAPAFAHDWENGRHAEDADIPEFYVEAPTRFDLAHRLPVIGAGAAALTLAFFLGDGILRVISKETAINDASISRTVPMKEAAVTSPASAAPVTVVASVTETDEVSDLTPLNIVPAVEERLTRNSEKSSMKADDDQARVVPIKASVPARASRTAEMKTVTQPIEATRVITVENGRVKTRLESEGNNSTRRSAPTQIDAGAVRPRIVKDPK